MRVVGPYVIYPKRGKPPPPPEGYIRTDDPFVFVKELSPCRRRSERLTKTSCCTSVKLYCIDEQIVYTDCIDCTRGGPYAN
jgi:hypothetical protein